MAAGSTVSLLTILVVVFFFFFSISLSEVESINGGRLKALVAPVTKDSATSLYSIAFRNPYTRRNNSYVINLISPFLWSACPRVHPTLLCNSPICSAANAVPPNCTKTLAESAAGKRGGLVPCRCVVTPQNPATGACGTGDLTTTDIAVATTDGHNPLAPATADGFVEACAAPMSLFAGLPAGATGVAGFARSSELGVARQLSAKLKIPAQFALCLPSNPDSESPGVAFFGSPPFFLLPPGSRAVSDLLSYTPLLPGPSSGPKDFFYYIGVENIAVNEVAVASAKATLAKSGGLARIRTTVPYTMFARSLYRPFIKAFKKSTSGYVRVPAISPFELCYNSSKLGSTRLGYAVPQIDLVVPGGRNWTFFGANSLKQVSGDAACLAVVDGGADLQPAVVIGGFQMEDNLVLFDQENSRFGFSNLLFGVETTCQNFNFTPGAA